MYKIMYIKTGHIFTLPEESAQELKDKFPDEYKIIEKNGKKYKPASAEEASAVEQTLKGSDFIVKSEE